MRFLFILVFLLFTFSCHKDSLQKSQTDNRNFDVELLFEHDGCKIYRFYDGVTRYFSKCDNAGHSKTEYRIQTGKTSRPEEIGTN